MAMKDVDQIKFEHDLEVKMECLKQKNRVELIMLDREAKREAHELEMKRLNAIMAISEKTGKYITSFAPHI